MEERTEESISNNTVPENVLCHQRTYYVLKPVYVTKAYEATNTGQAYILGTKR